MSHAEQLRARHDDVTEQYVTEQVAAAVGPLTEQIVALQADVAARDTLVAELQARIAALEQPQEPQPEPADVHPGDSVQAALDAAAEGATIRFAAGVYPLSTDLRPKARQRLVGPTAGYATFTGARMVTGWAREGAFWVASAPLPGAYSDDVGQCEVISGPNANGCRIREDVFVDGVLQTRVMSTSLLVEGTVYTDLAAGKIYLGGDPGARRVEVSITRYAINSSVDGVVLERLEFVRFASPSQQGAVQMGGDEWEVSGCRFAENHAVGLYFVSSNRTRVHDSLFEANGQTGLAHYRSTDTVIEDNVFRDNNTAGYWGADWESSGMKCTWSSRVIVRRNLSEGNRGVGLWFDIDNMDITCVDNVVRDNYTDGIRYEISFRAEIARNTLSGNGFGLATQGGRGSDYSMFATGAINVNTSSDVDIHHNTVGQNQNGIVVQHRSRGTSSTYNVPRDTQNVVVHDNEIDLTRPTGTRYGEGVAGLGTLGQSTPATWFTSKGNRFDGNAYRVTSATVRRFAWQAGYGTFAALQAAGQEARGRLEVVAQA